MDYVSIVNVIIIVAGILQGIILSALFFIKRCNNKTANLFLALLIFTLTVQLVLKLATKVWLLHKLNFAYWMSYEIPFLYGPLLYCYVKSSLRKSGSFKWNNLLHLIPFFYILLVKLMSSIFPDLHITAFFMPFFISQPILHGIIQIISISLYSFSALKIVDNYRNSLSPGSLYINLKQLSWLKTCILVVLFSVVTIIVAIKLLWFVYPAHPDWRLMFAALTILIYWISYKALSNPGIFHFQLNDINTPSSSLVSINGNPNSAPIKKYTNSKLSHVQLNMIINSLFEIMDSERSYKDPQLNIEQLSIQLNISKHQLSQAINDKLNKNFNEYVNELRVKESMKLLKDPEFDQYTIAAIASYSGFNSLASFNNAFKRHTGCTPSVFKKDKQLQE